MGNEVHGIELNPEAAKMAKKRGVKVKMADIEEGIPYPDDSFNGILAFEIIEHLFDTKFFLEECRRVLQKNGFIIISTPNLNGLYHRFLTLFGFHIHYLGTYPGDIHGDHIRIFNVRTLVDLLKMTGFEPDLIKGTSYFPIPLRQVFYHIPTFCELILMKASVI